MDCRVTGMLSISMALTQHYPQTVEKAPPRQSESLGGVTYPARAPCPKADNATRMHTQLLSTAPADKTLNKM